MTNKGGDGDDGGGNRGEVPPSVLTFPYAIAISPRLETTIRMTLASLMAYSLSYADVPDAIPHTTRWIIGMIGPMVALRLPILTFVIGAGLPVIFVVVFFALGCATMMLAAATVSDGFFVGMGCLWAFWIGFLRYGAAGKGTSILSQVLIVIVALVGLGLRSTVQNGIQVVISGEVWGLLLRGIERAIAAILGLPTDLPEIPTNGTELLLNLTDVDLGNVTLPPLPEDAFPDVPDDVKEKLRGYLEAVIEGIFALLVYLQELYESGAIDGAIDDVKDGIQQALIDNLAGEENARTITVQEGPLCGQNVTIMISDQEPYDIHVDIPGGMWIVTTIWKETGVRNPLAAIWNVVIALCWTFLCAFASPALPPFRTARKTLTKTLLPAAMRDAARLVEAPDDGSVASDDVDEEEAPVDEGDFEDEYYSDDESDIDTTEKIESRLVNAVNVIHGGAVGALTVFEPRFADRSFDLPMACTYVPLVRAVRAAEDAALRSLASRIVPPLAASSSPSSSMTRRRKSEALRKTFVNALERCAVAMEERRRVRIPKSFGGEDGRKELVAKEEKSAAPDRKDAIDVGGSERTRSDRSPAEEEEADDDETEELLSVRHDHDGGSELEHSGTTSSAAATDDAKSKVVVADDDAPEPGGGVEATETRSRKADAGDVRSMTTTDGPNAAGLNAKARPSSNETTPRDDLGKSEIDDESKFVSVLDDGDAAKSAKEEALGDDVIVAAVPAESAIDGPSVDDPLNLAGAAEELYASTRSYVASLDPRMGEITEREGAINFVKNALPWTAPSFAFLLSILEPFVRAIKLLPFVPNDDKIDVDKAFAHVKFVGGVTAVICMNVYWDEWRYYDVNGEEDDEGLVRVLNSPPASFAGWTLIAYAFASMPTTEGTVKKCSLRLVGTCVGAFSAWLILLWSSDNAVGMVSWLTLTTFVAAYYAVEKDQMKARMGSSNDFGYGPFYFVLTQCVITMEFLGGVGERDDLVANRIVSNVVGIMIAAVMSAFPPGVRGGDPKWARKMLDEERSALYESLDLLLKSDEEGLDRLRSEYLRNVKSRRTEAMYFLDDARRYSRYPFYDVDPVLEEELHSMTLTEAFVDGVIRLAIRIVQDERLRDAFAQGTELRIEADELLREKTDAEETYVSASVKLNDVPTVDALSGNESVLFLQYFRIVRKRLLAHDSALSGVKWRWHQGL